MYGGFEVGESWYLVRVEKVYDFRRLYCEWGEG